MITVGELKEYLATCPDYAWVCLKDGPVVKMKKELGASEPFILLECESRCPHGAYQSEPCPACQAVKEVIESA